VRVLHVAESIKGGCGTYLNQLARAQIADPAFERVHLLVPDVHLSQVAGLPAAHVSTFRSKGRTPASFHSLWRTMAALIAEMEPDCVHLHSTFAGAIGRLGLALRRHRPALLYCPHGWAFDMAGTSSRQRAMAVAERVLAPLCDRIVAISDYERERAIAVGIPAGQIVTVLNGMADLPRPSPNSAARRHGSRRRILFVGRLDRQKGVDVLLQAVAGLHDRIETKVIGSAVVGGALGPSPVPGITWLGWCDETRIREELAWADCLVVPSRWEGFGLVALEAMRAERPVIASRVGGLPEVVDHGVTGWLVPAENPEALREAILAPTDSELVEAGAAGRRRFLQRFTAQRMADQLLAHYREAIGRRSGDLQTARA